MLDEHPKAAMFAVYIIVLSAAVIAINVIEKLKG